MREVQAVPDRILSKRETAATTTLSMSSVMREVRAGNFPSPVRIGPRRIGWRSSDVAEWIKNRTGIRR